ncbi:hypothetical protein ACSBR2_031485 [Camellia fascicularis]
MAMWISQRLFCLFFLHAILLVSTQSSASTSQENSNLIRQTCRRTNNFNLCVASLESDPRSLKADVKGLARISLQQVLEPELKNTTKLCQLNYQEQSLHWIPMTMENQNKVQLMLGNDANLCEQQWASRSPVTNQNHAVRDLSMVAFGIISILA